MSGLQKRMRRKLLTQAARLQRKETAGHGKMRRPVRSWVQTTKVDMLLAVIESQRSAPSPSHSSDSPHEVTPR